MRKALVIFGLVTATLLAAAGDSFAQRRGGILGGGGGRGWGGGSGFYGGNGFYGSNGFYGGNGFYGNGLYGGRGYYGNGFGSSYYGTGYGYGSPYYGHGYGSYYQPYYGGNYYGNYNNGYYTPGYSNNGYYYDSSANAPSMSYRDSSYVDPNAAAITVILPDPNAQVWFDDTPTTQRGNERVFHTPALQQGGTYTIKARWNENGRTVDQQRTVQVQPGQSATVDFRASSASPR